MDNYSTLPADLTPSDTPSWTSGGTINALPSERAKATFDVQKLVYLLDGGEEANRKKHWILSMNERYDVRHKHDKSRGQLIAQSTKDFISIHRKFAGYRPSRQEVSWMVQHATNTGPVMPHYSLGLTTMVTQASDEQMGWWLMKCVTCEMIVCYAQTEIGHGSNVRGITTTATFDRKTDEFVIHTPTLLGIKWWNSGLGCVATHALVYAQLIIDGKEYGVHVFMVQVRDVEHRPFPGIEVGDMGNKMGDAALDTGFIRFDHFRIPRKFMLERHQHVTNEGQYVKSKSKAKGSGDSRIIYYTMMSTRGSMVYGAGAFLARSCTIAIRYSCVRVQGFLDGSSQGHLSNERKIIDYGVQRYRLFKQLATCYGLMFIGQWLMGAMERATSEGEINPEALPEMHATTSGLKGMSTFMAAEGMEDLRKACGGNGFLMSNGIGPHWADFVWQVTAEGDYVVLMLQTARYLFKMFNMAKEKKSSLPPLCSYLVDNVQHPKVPQSAAEFSDLENLKDWFGYRANVYVVAAGNAMDKLIKSGVQFDDAFNACSVHWFAAVTAHCMLFILRKFMDALHRASDADIKEPLTHLCVLFAVSDMIDGKWNGVIPLAAAEFAQATANAACDALRPNAVALVDAFEYPDRVLQSCIGRYDGNIYEALYDSARHAPLNKTVPFDGFAEHLKPFLDIELLKKGNQVPAKL